MSNSLLYCDSFEMLWAEKASRFKSSIFRFEGYIIADKGYDSEEIRELIREKGSTPLIPRKKNSKTGNDDMDWCLYKYRHLVENIFARLKHFRAIATRYDKLKRNYASMLAMACSYLWLPM